MMKLDNQNIRNPISHLISFRTYKNKWNGKEKKMRYFFDMDGVLAEWRGCSNEEDLYKKGYFISLQPQENLVKTALYLQSAGLEVYILSCYLEDSPYALQEKKEWVDKWMPFIPKAQRIFVPCGRKKADFVPGGIRPEDVLLDDYTVNLNSWPGKKVKVQNPWNCKKGSAHEAILRWDELNLGLLASL